MTNQRRGATQTRAPLRHDPASLVWVRRQAGWTQSRLAETIGISKGHLSQIESGKRNATLAVLDAISVALDCPRSLLERKLPAVAA